MSAVNIDNLCLLKFGINVPPAQRYEAIRLIKANSVYKEDFETIRNSLKTMTDYDYFLNVIKQSHQAMINLPEYTKMIQLRYRTFQIRSINPENISSLTERAFFNSFNLERIVLNDLEYYENYFRYSQKNIKMDYSRRYKEIKRKVSEEKDYEIDITKKVHENEYEIKCICGKVVDGVNWVQCSSEAKCRGSNWYHIECSGMEAKNEDEIYKEEFTCESCRRYEESSEMTNKKLKKD